jgi:hypothetical protein
MQNIRASSGYQLSPSRLQTLTTPETIAWPSIMHALAMLSLALDNYLHNPENSQVRTTFIQTVNQMLTTNAIIRGYFENEKGYGYYLAKIFKSEPSSWGQSNSYAAERLAKISQILIDKYHIKDFLERGSRLISAYKLPLNQLRTSSALFDYDKAHPIKLQPKILKLNGSNIPLRFLGIRIRSNASLRQQIQLLAKYNLPPIQHAYISFFIRPNSAPLKVRPLSELLKSKLHNLTKLTFEVEAQGFNGPRAPELTNQINRLNYNFWQQIRQHKQIAALDLDFTEIFKANGQKLNSITNALKYLKNLTSLSLKLKGLDALNREEMADFLQNIKRLSKLAHLNFRRVQTTSLSDELLIYILPQILDTISSFNNLAELIINIKQIDYNGQYLPELSKVILTLPKLSILAIHLETYAQFQDQPIDQQPLSQLISTLNLTTSLTKLRMVLPNGANAAISILKALLDLKNSIALELQLVIYTHLLKSIANATSSLDPTLPPFRTLSKLSLVFGLGHDTSFYLTEHQGTSIEDIYFTHLQQLFKYWNSLPVLKLELYQTDKLTPSILKALAGLNHLIELEIVVSEYLLYLQNKNDFLLYLSHTVNNLKGLTSFKLTLDFSSDAMRSGLLSKPFISFIKSLKPLARFKLSLYQLPKPSFADMKYAFIDYINTLNTTPHSHNSWYTLIISTSTRGKLPSHEHVEFNYYF